MITTRLWQIWNGPPIILSRKVIDQREAIVAEVIVGRIQSSPTSAERKPTQSRADRPANHQRCAEFQRVVVSACLRATGVVMPSRARILAVFIAIFATSEAYSQSLEVQTQAL